MNKLAQMLELKTPKSVGQKKKVLSLRCCRKMTENIKLSDKTDSAQTISRPPGHNIIISFWDYAASQIDLNGRRVRLRF